VGAEGAREGEKRNEKEKTHFGRPTRRQHARTVHESAPDEDPFATECKHSKDTGSAGKGHFEVFRETEGGTYGMRN
jgi:hypothetical protein